MLLMFGFHIFCSIVSCAPRVPQVKVQDLVNSNQIRIRDTTINNRSSFINISRTDLFKELPIVKTENGWLQGYFQNTIRGRLIAAFESIPYGKSIRFEKPEPVSSWEGLKKANRRPPACLQLDFSKQFTVHGTENCLFLNVYTPSIPPFQTVLQRKLPVLIYIHGGGYQCGTSSESGPAYLLDKDVILVTVNYRVGVLGFLSTGTGSGNWGLKDQVLAMKWVSKNIENFGGDSAKVTLIGLSAGAASVGLHLVSKKSEGLFHQAICQSGFSTTHWAIQNDTVSNSKIVARAIKCPTNDSESMINCLRKQDANWIVGQSIKTWRDWTISRVPFGPIIETPSEDAFLDEAPEVTYLKGGVKPVPLIIGLNQDEGGLFAASIYITPLMLRKFNKKWNYMASYSLAYDKRTNDTAKVSQKIKQFYLNGEKKLTFWNRQGWMQAFGDRTIVQGTYAGMQYHSKIGPTYAYLFSYKGKHSLLNLFGLKTGEWGVTHGDESVYIFNSTSNNPLEFGGKDYQMSEFVIKLWTNFANTGVPFDKLNEQGDKVEIWSKVKGPSEVELLEINECPKMVQMPFAERLQFWKDLKLKDDHDYPITLN